MHFPRNWEFGSALSKLRNNFGGVWTSQTPPLGTPVASVICPVENAWTPSQDWRHLRGIHKQQNSPFIVILSTYPGSPPAFTCCRFSAQDSVRQTYYRSQLGRTAVRMAHFLVSFLSKFMHDNGAHVHTHIQINSVFISAVMQDRHVLTHLMVNGMI
jgi:hypothetical protein